MQTKPTFQCLNRPMIWALVFLFSMLFYVSIVSANPNWYNFGNVGANYLATGADNLLFASNYPQGNVNFTEIPFSVSSTYTPIVADLDQDGTAEIFFFAGGYVSMFDDTGNQIALRALTGSVASEPIIINKDNDAELEVFILTENSSHYIYNILSKTGSTLGRTGDILTAKTEHSLYDVSCGGIGLNDEVVFFNKTGTPVILDYSTDSVTEGTAVTLSIPNVVHRSAKISIITGGHGQMADWDIDGNQECLLFTHSGSNLQYNVYEPETDTWEFEHEKIIGFTGGAIIDGAFANIGSESSPLEIITCYSTTDSDVVQCSFINLITKVMTNTTQLVGSTDSNILFPFVNDFNNDGQNEVCYSGDNLFHCWDSAFNEIIADVPNVAGAGYMASGEYDAAITANGKNWQEVITELGVYSYNGSTLNMVYNFTSGWSGQKPMFLPVSIAQQSTFTKDILGVSPTKAIYYVASGTSAVCGNGVCESFETALNCYEDCANVNTTTINDTQGNFGAFHECSSDTDCYDDMVCVGNICQGRTAGAACVYDFECESGVCNEFGFCERTDFVQVVQNGANYLGFTSVASKLFLSFILILLGMGVGAGIGSAGGIFGVALGAIVGLFIGSLMSVVVFGWLGAAVVFTLLFVGVIVTILTMIFKGG